MGAIHIDRDILNQGIRVYFLDELKKEFRDDFQLVADRIDALIPFYTIKEAKQILKREIILMKSADKKK